MPQNDAIRRWLEGQTSQSLQVGSGQQLPQSQPQQPQIQAQPVGQQVGSFSQSTPQHLQALETQRARSISPSQTAPLAPAQGAGFADLFQHRNYGEGIATSQLQGQLANQRGQLAFYGEDVPEKEKNPGMFNRVVDILMRVNYGLANASKTLVSQDGPDETIGRALLDGLSGKSKTTFSDVLGEAGVQSDLVKGIGGFVLDVALDPTTYIGAGVVKAAGRSAVEAAGAQAYMRTLQSPAAKKAAAEAAENRLMREMAEGLAPGAKKGQMPVLEKQQALLKKYEKDELTSLAREQLDLAKQAADTAGKVEFKFAGRKFGESSELYAGISKAFKPLRELDPVQRLNKMFRPKAELGPLHDITRLHEGVSIGMFEDHLSLFKEMMGNFNPEQRKLLTHVLEGTRTTNDTEMVKAADHIRRLFKTWFDDELAAGIHKSSDQFIDNYVYHMYKVDPEKAIAYKKGAKKGKPGFAKERKLPTIEEAKLAGMKPVEDILQIVQERAAKHFQEMTHISIMEDAVKNFGIMPKNVKEAKRVQAALRKLDTDLEKFTYIRPDGERLSALVPREVKNVLEDLNRIHGDPNYAKGFLRMADKVQTETKFWLTVANPGHHIRNFVGNAYMAYQDGVRNPERYRQAFIGVAGDMAKSGSPQKIAAQTKRIKIGNGYSSAEELMQLYKMTGTKSGFYDIEVARNMTGKASRAVRRISTGREDTARLGHFIDAVAKTNKNADWSKMTMAQKQAAAMDASRRVRKFQLDYGDLTQFEKNVARRIMMFYTFARKNTALQMEMLFTRPGKIGNVGKANTAIQQMLGIDTPAHEDEDFWERVPEWVRKMGAPQLGGEGNIVQKILGTNDPVYGNMLLPTSDLNRIPDTLNPVSAFQQIAKSTAGEMRPELKIPMEQAFGRSAFTGAPVDADPAYISQQIPITNLIRKIMDPEASTNQNIGQDIFNYLTGLSLQTVTPQRQQSELRRQQQQVQDVQRNFNAQNMEDFITQLKENIRRSHALSQGNP